MEIMSASAVVCSLERNLDCDPVQASYRNYLTAAVSQLSGNITQQILGKKRYPSVVLLSDQPVCFYLCLAPFVKAHGRIYQPYRGNKVEGHPGGLITTTGLR